MATGYGGRGREWHPDFLQYMIEIVTHPNYDGIPGGLDAEGRVDWTIPSNRKEGSKNWDGNARRRDWWRRKATSFDVPLVGQWLSRTARLNHPFQEKPCQICGRVMSIRYAYPSARGQEAFQSAFPAVDFEWSAIETVFEALLRLKSEVGEATALEGIAGVFTRQGEDRPGGWTALMMRVDGYVDGASRLLSPGAMSNCPDRLDGFHTYNLCCRRFWIEQVGMVEKARPQVGDFAVVQVGFVDQEFAFELVPLARMADNPDGLDLATPSIALQVDDLEAARAQLVDRGVTAVEIGEYSGVRSFAFSDPEGRWFAVTG